MAIAAEDERQANLWPYVLQFGVLYIVASVVVTAIEYAFDLDTYAGANIGIMIASAIVPVRRFVLDHRRPFNRREQGRFALLALVAGFVVDLVHIALVILFAGELKEFLLLVDELSATTQDEVLVMAIGLIVMYLLLFAVMYFLAEIFSRSFSKRLADKGKI
ncbi:MAG: ABZJ_00895 family protein [Hyphomicrobium sp.]